jgi:hypothetical protein
MSTSKPVLSSAQLVQGPACGFKRRREELELLRMEEEVKAMAQTRIINAGVEIERILDPTRSNLDYRTRLMVQEAMQKSILDTVNVNSSNSAFENRSITVRSVAKDIGYEITAIDCKRIEADLCHRYIKKYGQSPPKHDRICDTEKYSYTEKYRSLVVEAVDAYFASDPEDDETQD